MTQNEAESLLQLIGEKTLQEIKDVHALSVILDQNEYKINMSCAEGEQSSPELIQFIENNFPGMGNPVNFTFSRSNKLEFFSPHPICSQHESPMEGVVKGSCGPFIESKKNNRIGLLSSDHVMPSKGSKFLIARLFSLDSVDAKSDWKDSDFDIGIADLDSKDVTDAAGWSMFSTSIGIANIKDKVYHYGGASVEEVSGTVISTSTIVTLGSRTFHNLIRLKIDSKHGDSGSPVVNEKSEVIGLIVGGDTQSREIYCSNLELAKTGFPEDYQPDKLLLCGTRGFLNIKLEERRREIELQLRTGRVIRNPDVSKNTYGEILTSEIISPQETVQVSVLIHPKHSFSGAVDWNKPVWFFAVPLEYIVKQKEMVGTNNQTPLVAINISNERRSLKPLRGLHKRTPCGTGTTVATDQNTLFGAAFGIPVMEALLPVTHNFYIINDYGHLVIAKHNKNDTIQAWEKIVCMPDIRNRKSSQKSTPKFERELLDSDFKEVDSNWKWEP